MFNFRHTPFAKRQQDIIGYLKGAANGVRRRQLRF